MLKPRNKTPVLWTVMLYERTKIVSVDTFQVKNQIRASLYIF